MKKIKPKVIKFMIHIWINRLRQMNTNTFVWEYYKYYYGTSDLLALWTVEWALSIVRYRRILEVERPALKRTRKSKDTSEEYKEEFWVARNDPKNITYETRVEKENRLA